MARSRGADTDTVVRAKSGRPLTAAQHAFIRRQLVLIPAYVWLVYAWQIFFRQLPLGVPGPDTRVFRDFVYFYVVGAIARARDLQALYSMEAQDALIARLVPAVLDTHFPPSYGPQVSLFFAPLARLPYVAALQVWLAATVVLYLVCGYVIWRRCPRLRDRKWEVCALLLAAPALHFDLSYAQTSALALACFTVAFLALRAGRPWIAGLAIGSLVYKPQLGLAAAVVFVYAREWRVVLGAVGGAGAQIGAGVLYWGPSVLGDYARALAHIPAVMSLIEPEKQQLHSWRSFFQLIGLSPAVVFWATLVASLLTLAVACRCWRTRGALAVRYSVLLLATVLVNPHAYAYDLLVLTPMFLVLWDWSLSLGSLSAAGVWPPIAVATRQLPFAAVILGVLAFCAASPLLGPVSLGAHVQFSVVGFCVLGGFLAQFLRDSGGTGPQLATKLSSIGKT